MSFSWAEALTQYVTKPKASHVTELQTNIDTLRSLTGLGAYSWSRTPAQYDPTRQDSGTGTMDYLQLRTALDEAHTNNYCHTYYATYLATHLASNLVTYLATHNASYCATHYTTHLSSNLTTYRATHYTTHYSTHNTGYNGTYNNAGIS
jgi:hypothetical protein